MQNTEVNLPWEKGIIGEIETFLLNRFNFNPMWARALATTLVSAAIPKMTINDEMGEVKGNLYFVYIAKSGLGFKTPSINFLRKFLIAYNRNVISVSKFTPEGYTEWVGGTSQKLSSDGKETRKAVQPHPVNVIVRDEASVILGENKFSPHLATQKEYISKLWDGWIEGYYTRKMQFEGNLPVYVSLCACSSEYFYDLLDEDFFTQGTGNRILWITQEMVEPKKINPIRFFFNGEKDDELEVLIDSVIGKLRRLEATANAFITGDAAKLWTDFQHEYMIKASHSEGRAGAYCVKLPLNALKLAINYSSSCLHIENNNLFITKEDMKQAIEDVRKYEAMWRETMKQWKNWTEGEKHEKRLTTSKYDLRKFLAIGLQCEGKMFSASTIRSMGEYPDKTKVNEIINLGVEKGWFEVVADANTQGKLTDEEYKRFKPKTGFSPQVFKVTQKGEEDN